VAAKFPSVFASKRSEVQRVKDELLLLPKKRPCHLRRAIKATTPKLLFRTR
jgi:hypothetical protein